MIVLEHKQPQETRELYIAFLETLALLIRSEAIFRGTGERIPRLAAQVAGYVQNTDSPLNLTLVVEDEEIQVNREGISLEGPLLELKNHLKGLNLKKVLISKEASPEDILTFVSALNDNLRLLNKNDGSTADWSMLPKTVTFEESKKARS